MRRLRGVAVETFNCAESDFGAATVAPDIRGWDSLSHTVFMMNVEQEFGIEFPLESISSLGTVADLATAISELVNQPKP